MATLIYSTGNGYYCGCCRRTTTDYLDFDSENIDGLIAECIDIACSNDWDFSVSTIKGFTHETMDEYELENLIEAECKKAEKRKEHADEIKRLQSQIKSIDNWFDGLEATKISKRKERDEIQKKLEELGA